MIERIWSGKSWLRWPLLPLSLLYGLITGLIRLTYRLGLRRAWRAPVPVVVVGNLTAGGSGKTPVVVWLTEQLQQRGIKVGIVSRGYGGKADAYPLVLTNETSAAQAGDEPVLIYQRTGACVAVAPKRCQAVQALLAHCAPQIVITDDGLQHYALARDKEIVVVDGVRRFGNGWWLPAGPMRETASRLRSVDAVIVNGGTAGENEIAMQLKPGEAIHLYSGRRLPVSQLSPVVAIAGIGHPPRFFKTLADAGVTVSKTHALADHQALSQAEITALIQPGETLLMTEKDAVKYRPYASASSDWWYLPVDACFNDAAADDLLNALASLVRGGND